MTQKWRLILSDPSDGAYNMALDESFLRSAASRQSPPTLRLFSWEPPTLSLGYAQKKTDVNFSQLNNLGWGLVRRPTGGRAILHTDELTYSITAPLNNPVMAGSLLDSYRRISRALLRALDLLGITAQGDSVYDPAPGQTKNEPVCFEVPSNFEITVAGKKLIGSAQARKFNGVLQHGSLPLTGDLSRITRVLHYPSETKRLEGVHRLLSHAGTIESLTGIVVSMDKAKEAFINAFTSELDIELIAGEPTDAEIELTGELMTNKYRSDDWNLRL